MRILTVFYSLEGNCRVLAEVIREAVGGEVEALRPETELSRQGVRRYLNCGKMAFFGQSGPNKPLAFNIADFDLIFVGTPVWAWHMTPPVLRFLTEADWSGRKVALYSMSGGMPGGTLRAMRKLVEARGGRVIAAADFRDLRRGNPDAIRAKATAWAKETAGQAG